MTAGREAVASRFRLGPTGTGRYGIEVGAYDGTRPLVIDPGIVWAAGIGGGGATDVAVDAAGSTYVTGSADSGPATLGAFDTTPNGGGDAFVAKLNPAGTALDYWTFVGGGGVESVHAIAIDSAGNAYVTGRTVSGDYPTTSVAFHRSFGGSNDVVVTKLSADGSSLVYSTFLGGANFDVAFGVAVDGDGNAYVSGSAQSGFPTTAGVIAPTLSGFQDAFVTS